MISNLYGCTFCPKWFEVIQHNIIQYKQLVPILLHYFGYVPYWRWSWLLLRLGTSYFGEGPLVAQVGYMGRSLPEAYRLNNRKGDVFDNFGSAFNNMKFRLWCSFLTIKVITKLPNSEQSYKGKVKTHNYINRQNQSTTGKLWKP